MQTITVRPAEGLLIRDPILLDHIEAEGRLVQLSDYWRRRLRDGDVVEVPDATPHTDATPDSPDAA